MLTIRLAKAEWAKAWRAMIEVAPVRLVADDPVYERYLEKLKGCLKKKFGQLEVLITVTELLAI